MFAIALLRNTSLTLLLGLACPTEQTSPTATKDKVNSQLILILILETAVV